MAVYMRDQLVKCPHCGKHTEDPVQDFVVPNRFKPHREECVWCNEKFTTTENEVTGTFEVTK